MSTGSGFVCTECLKYDAFLCRNCAEVRLRASVDVTLTRFHGLYLRWFGLSSEERREELGHCINQLSWQLAPPSHPPDMECPSCEGTGSAMAGPEGYDCGSCLGTGKHLTSGL